MPRRGVHQTSCRPVVDIDVTAAASAGLGLQHDAERPAGATVRELKASRSALAPGPAASTTSSTMTIFVANLLTRGGIPPPPMSLAVAPGDTVASVKKRIPDTYGLLASLPPGRVHLVRGSNDKSKAFELEDASTLWECGVRDGDELMLIVQLGSLKDAGSVI